MSLSSWRAWIEIGVSAGAAYIVCGRSPHGERGLKYRTRRTRCNRRNRRSPHGERGLKC